ncbi:MAG: DUF1080 domain-containing protein [Verrucomicrobia bacterium]|nr:DUF1080 domain-containing protein [Verrucomicrobiota bacterium]
MNPRARFLFWFVLLPLVASFGFAAAAKRISLFDGKSLQGWKLVTCEAEVQEGAIFLKAGNGLVQTERKYRDFVFEFEWKALKSEKWDSGIYFRYDTITPPRPWPRRYQVNLRQGEEGSIPGLKETLTKGLFRDREWNAVKLTVRGTTATLEVNGRPAWSIDGLEAPFEGYVGLQSEVAGGGQHLFRKIYLTEL